MTRNQERTDSHEHEFIMTIKKALGKSSHAPLPEPYELFGQPPQDLEHRLHACLNKSQSKQTALLDLFMAQAELINMTVIPVKNPSQAGLAIRELIQRTEPEWGTKKRVAAWHHPMIEQMDLKNILAPDGVSLFTTQASPIPDANERQAIRSHIHDAYMGITSADFCVAQSATLVMRTRPGHPRAVSLVPAIHVAVIRMDQILESLAELYFRLKYDPKEQEQGLSNCMTFISGPSKTADIEIIMVHGAHGPRQMVVYVITG